MFVKVIDHKRLQISTAWRWNQSVKGCYAKLFSYNLSHEPWYGALEIQLFKFRITVYIWRYTL